MKDEKLKVKINDEIQELTLDELRKVAGGADDAYCYVGCPTGCGFKKGFDTFVDAYSYLSKTKSCPNCRYDEGSSPKLCVNCSACIMLPSPGRQPAACVPAADAKEGHPCRAVKGCPAFGQRAVP